MPMRLPLRSKATSGVAPDRSRCPGARARIGGRSAMPKRLGVSAPRPARRAGKTWAHPPRQHRQVDLTAVAAGAHHEGHGVEFRVHGDVHGDTAGAAVTGAVGEADGGGDGSEAPGLGVEPRGGWRASGGEARRASAGDGGMRGTFRMCRYKPFLEPEVQVGRAGALRLSTTRWTCTPLPPKPVPG